MYLSDEHLSQNFFTLKVSCYSVCLVCWSQRLNYLYLYVVCVYRLQLEPSHKLLYSDYIALTISH